MVRKLVMAFGAFDGILAEHVGYLKDARRHGTALSVVIARDKTTWRPERTFSFNEHERLHAVEALGIADSVLLGSEKDPLERIREHRPDIVAVTPHHNVDPLLLQQDLQRLGLESSVVVVNLRRI